MRTLKGQTMFCVPAFFLLSIGGSAHLSSDRVTVPSPALAATRVSSTSAQTQKDTKGAARKWVASWYGRKFQGRRTSSGDRFDSGKLTAANRTLPLGSLVRLTSPRTGQSVVVRINDRGPWIKNRDFDLSEAAALELGIHQEGVAAVEAVVLK